MTTADLATLAADTPRIRPGARAVITAAMGRTPDQADSDDRRMRATIAAIRATASGRLDPQAHAVDLARLTGVDADTIATLADDTHVTQQAADAEREQLSDARPLRRIARRTSTLWSAHCRAAGDLGRWLDILVRTEAPADIAPAIGILLVGASPSMTGAVDAEHLAAAHGTSGRTMERYLARACAIIATQEDMIDELTAGDLWRDRRADAIDPDESIGYERRQWQHDWQRRRYETRDGLYPDADPMAPAGVEEARSILGVGFRRIKRAVQDGRTSIALARETIAWYKQHLGTDGLHRAVYGTSSPDRRVRRQAMAQIRELDLA